MAVKGTQVLEADHGGFGVSGLPKPRAATIVSFFVAGVLATPPARAGEVTLEVGLRAGYVFGGGWTAGPGVSLVRGGPPTPFFERHVIPLGERGHEVDLDARWWSLPFTSPSWAGVCGALGGLEPRPA